MKKIELKKLTIELIGSNIVLIRIKDHSSIEENDIIEAKEHNLKLTEGKAYAIVLETGDFTDISQEARAAMASEKMEANRKATALVITKFAQKLIGNFYLRVNKPSVPTRMFSEKEKAMTWAKEILAKT